MDRQPLYSRIADQLAKDIAKGRYAVGTTLPAEPDLALQLKVSRSTVRAALASLEARKLVSRKKNSGTRVEAVSPQGDYGASLTSLSDLIQWAQACERSVQHTGEIVMAQALAKELGCDAGSQWLCIQSLRFDAARGKLPVSWTNAYIDIQYANVLKAIQAQPSALMSELLEKEFGLDLATVEQDVTGCKLDAPLAKRLNADKDEAALQVVRRYLTRDGHPVLVTVSIHPAKRFSIRTTLTRN
jgi:DNA-binding GntR family transcriptional regulator